MRGAYFRHTESLLLEPTYLGCKDVLTAVIVLDDQCICVCSLECPFVCVHVELMLLMLLLQMPAVLTALQRSVHGVLLGKVIRPDWNTHGVPKNSQIDTFHVKMSGGI